MRVHIALLGTLCTSLLALLSCTDPANCARDSDCATGEICNALHACVQPSDPVKVDAGIRDRVWPDRREPDTGPEDLIGQDLLAFDLTPADNNIQHDVRIDAGVEQVQSIDTCNGPRALAIDSNNQMLYVACDSADRIEVYETHSGVFDRRLTSLPAPCAPSAMLLRDDISNGGQLWVSCASSTNHTVQNIDPGTGAALESPGFAYSGINNSARFASAGNYIAWAAVGTSAYSIRSISHRSSTTSVFNASNANSGSDLAMRSDGTYLYIVNTQSNIIYKLQTSGFGTQQLATSGSTFNTNIAITPLQATAPAAPVLIVVSATQQGYLRIREDGTGIGEGFNSVTLTQNVSLTMRRDGVAAYLTSSAGQIVYRISTDPSDSTPTQAQTSIAGCEAADLVAAVDGRVFVACHNLNRVQVIAAEDL